MCCKNVHVTIFYFIEFWKLVTLVNRLYLTRVCTNTLIYWNVLKTKIAHKIITKILYCKNIVHVTFFLNEILKISYFSQNTILPFTNQIIYNVYLSRLYNN